MSDVIVEQKLAQDITSGKQPTALNVADGELGSKTIDRPKIIEGKGLEVIAEAGWSEYRKALVDIPYSEIAENQSAQIKQLETSSSDSHKTTSPTWVVEEITRRTNHAALSRARRLIQHFTNAYGKDSLSSVVAHAGEKKLMISGRGISRDAQGNPTDLPVTRIYFTVATDKAPEVFEALRKTFIDMGIMSEFELALNLESYQAESLSKPFENNTLIAYIYGQRPDLLTKMAKGILRAKREYDPDIWKLSNQYLAQAKRMNIEDFMIPLDDTTAFAEMDSLRSYHSGPSKKMFTDLMGGWTLDRMITTEQIISKLKSWTPQTPGLFPDEPRRRRYMPALVFDKK
jgi:hypothetical protein